MNNIRILRFLPHYLRKKFNQKLIVIESDDWGLERAIEVKSFDYLRKKYSDEKFTRWTCDALETVEDLDLIFDLLGNYRDKFEFPPVITANFITHNIDYSSADKLKFIPLSSGFNNGSEDTRKKYSEGIKKKYIHPQLHGFSHFNLSELGKYFYTDEARESLANGFATARSTIRGNMKFLQGELSISNEQNRINESADEFQKAFGFRSDTIIPPTFIMDASLINELKECGISMLQSSNRLLNSYGKRYSVPYFRKRKGMVWSVRNARLDPHKDYGFYSDECFDQIGKAFDNKLPAVIDMHRVNISGKYAPEYRNKTLSELRKLFDRIHRTWKDVKFLNSSELNNLIWQQEIR
ncbi:MAG: hypothetical protein JSS91_04210 [Bacteroidetes bacterium]|nr:hypothetical protein [Bacteroidota bacterium]